MKKKIFDLGFVTICIFLGLLLVLTLIISVSAYSTSNFSNNGLCFQESTLEPFSNDGYCELNYNGDYTHSGTWGSNSPSDYDKLTDGNYNTFTNAGNGAIFGFNYVKTLEASNGIWQIKDSIGYQNISIPIGCSTNSVWYYDHKSNYVQLRVEYNNVNEHNYYYCNNSGWQLIGSSDLTGTSHSFYEESVYWIISNNVTFSGNENYTRYLQVPSNTILTNGFMNLTGYINYILTYSDTPNSNLKAYYHLDNQSNYGENSTNVHDFSNNNNMLVTGSVWNNTGKYGGGYTFSNSNDKLNISTDLIGTGNDSVCAWIKQFGWNFNGGIYNITYVLTNGQFVLTTRNTALRQNTFEISNDNSVTTLDALNNVTLNSWQHVCATRNSTGWGWIYVNGVLQSNGNSGTPSASTYSIIGNKVSNDRNFNGTIDEVMIFNKTLSSSEVNSIYTTTKPDFTYPSNLELSIGDTYSVLIEPYNYNYSSKLPNLANYINSYLSSCSYIAGYCYVPFTFHSDTAGILMYSDLIFNNNRFTENLISYNSLAQSGSYESFSINLTYDNFAYSGITAYLNYNNTNYSTTTSGTGSNKVFSSTISVPISSSTINKSFYFIVSLTNSSGTTYINSNINNQTLSPFLIDNCTTNSVRLLNLSIYDEDSLVSINGTIETLVNVYSTSNQLILTYNNILIYTGTPVSVCLNNLTSNYTLSYTLKYYGNSSYFKQYKNVQYMSIYNNFPTQDVKLYDLLYSNGYAFNVIVVGNILSSNGNSNLLVDAQRQYLPINQFLSIESSVTDSDGIGITHLVPSTEVYNFIVSYNGVILGTFNNYQVQCQNPSIGQCSITLNLAQATGSLPDFNNYGNITSSYNLDKVNNILYFTFTSTDGLIKNITQIVTKNDGYGNTTICTNNVIANSGTLICNIPTIYQNTNFFSEIVIDGKLVNTQLFSLGNELRNTNLYGVDILIELLMFSTLVMLFLSHPILIIFGAILGMFLAIGLIIITGGSWAGVIASLAFFVCAGVIIIIRISKKV